MKNLFIPTSALLLSGVILPLSAATILEYNGADSYVDSDQSFARTATNSGSGPYVSDNPFSDSSQLSPSSDYTGPTFYGGYIYTSSAVEGYLSSRQQIRDYASGDQIFVQAYRGGGWADTTLSLHGIYIFNQADFNSGFESGSIALDGVSLSWTGYINTVDASSTFDGRLAIQKDGSYYLSQTTIDLAQGSGSFSISGSTLSNELWAVYDPSTSLDFDASSASFNSLELTSITAVGLYYEEDGWGGSDAATTSFGLGIKTFEATGTVIPEKSQVSVLFGIISLVIAGAYHRQRKATQGA
ncbi:hypothetical protein [Cerasicoccus frondis]|uniref:hypothetical protein n=1 Tax=Cerasicoccus frondis TaxID=490090 RepID=UPI0028527B0A|nr:hypothetical protein [Cerasicoccus frondis]